jgi:hypothetical protein
MRLPKQGHANRLWGDLLYPYPRPEAISEVDRLLGVAIGLRRADAEGSQICPRANPVPEQPNTSVHRNKPAPTCELDLIYTIVIFYERK